MLLKMLIKSLTFDHRKQRWIPNIAVGMLEETTTHKTSRKVVLQKNAQVILFKEIPDKKKAQLMLGFLMFYDLLVICLNFRLRTIN